MIKDEHIRHDPNLVAESIIELICDDLKYQDKQNDPQYLMLNNKLREEKRINKIKRNMEKKEKREKNGKSKKAKQKGNTSKFSNKYSERIASIREADEKAKIKMEKQEAKKNKKSTKTSKNTTTKPKSARGKKKTPQQIREEMLKELENSKLNKK